MNIRELFKNSALSTLIGMTSSEDIKEEETLETLINSKDKTEAETAKELKRSQERLNKTIEKLQLQARIGIDTEIKSSRQTPKIKEARIKKEEDLEK